MVEHWGISGNVHSMSIFGQEVISFQAKGTKYFPPLNLAKEWLALCTFPLTIGPKGDSKLYASETKGLLFSMDMESIILSEIS